MTNHIFTNLKSLQLYSLESMYQSVRRADSRKPGDGVQSRLGDAPGLRRESFGENSVDERISNIIQEGGVPKEGDLEVYEFSMAKHNLDLARDFEKLLDQISAIKFT